MNKRLLLATSAAVVIATAAYAQSGSNSSTSTPSASQQQPSSSTTPSTAQSSSSSSSTSAQTQQAPSSQNAAGQSSSTGTSASHNTAPSSSTNQAQTNSPSSQTRTNTQSSQTSSPSNQAQTTPSSNSRAQTANPSSTNNNQAQQSRSGASSTNTAEQPSHDRSAERSSSTNVNASVNINDQQRTRISQSVSHLNVQPLSHVNFSLSVGTAVPHDVRLQPLPSEVVEIVPQYRGYDFVLVKDEIVIVEPSSYKIVAVLPYSGRSTAAAPARTEQRTAKFSERDRDVIRKHARARPAERVTTGSTVRTEIRTGEIVPEGVEIEAFPEDVYRDAPDLREYRYINRDSRTYIVDPHERRVIEEID